MSRAGNRFVDASLSGVVRVAPSILNNVSPAIPDVDLLTSPLQMQFPIPH